ncbi:MAG: M48 family metalloprotease [Proteobacteria bacterium]|nr:M48 family metalloprotease [Pseudomonadota bacterium]
MPIDLPSAPPAVHLPAVRKPRHWRTRFVAGLAVLALLVPAAPLRVAAQSSSLPSLGDPTGADFGLNVERRLGDRIMREIRVDPDYLDDPVLLDYLQTSIWQPLVAEDRKLGNITPELDEHLAWEVFLVRDKEVNAFALPGGYVGVNLGLMAMTSTRDELASVLGHEMSHVTQRHIARMIANNSKISLVGMAAMLLGILAAAKSSSPDAAQAAVVGSQAVMAQGQLNFSRDMEREADRIGFRVMTGAGFSAAGMADMFEKLDKASRLNDSGGFPYLRNHPLTSERIGDARARVATVPVAPPVSVLEHTLAQARARVLMDTRVDALRRWQALDGDRVTTAPVDRIAGAYEAALASTLLRDWDRADASLATLRELVTAEAGRRPLPGVGRAERAVAMLAAQSMLARGNVSRAAAELKPYDADQSRPILLLRTQLALAGADRSAIEQRASDLQTWVAVHPNDSTAWQMLGQLWERLNQPLRAIRADAESRIALGDLPGGIDRLRAGQRRTQAGGASDFIDASVIDSRLRTIEAQRRQEVADEKADR